MKSLSFFLICLLNLINIKPATAQGNLSIQLAGRLVIDTIHSIALEHNIVGDEATQQVAIYLPPTYDADISKRYPVVYLLHSFNGSEKTWTRAWPGLFGSRAGVALMDSVIAAGRVSEFIIVMPNGRNRYYGSFFSNSPITGNWEDFLTRDLISYIDKKYRTLSNRESRGVAGHSMGGNAAIQIAMSRPDIFGAVYSLSPCCLAGFDVLPAEIWKRLLTYESLTELEQGYIKGDFFSMVLVAAAAGITPNSSKPPFYVDLPYKKIGGEIYSDESILHRWQKAAPISQVTAKESNLRSLNGIRVDHGNQELELVMSGTRVFSDELSLRGISHGYEVYDGNHHNKIMERLATRVLPFFDATLKQRLP